MTVPLDQRGTTRMPASVVARIAQQAAAEVPNVGSDAGGFLGVGARRDFSSRPQARCELYGRSAVVDLDVGVGFPSPLPAVLGALRAHVRDRIEHLTGLELARLDVRVSWLHPTTTGRRTLR